MQGRNYFSERNSEHRSVFLVEVEYDFTSPIDCVGGIKHVPLNLSGLLSVHCFDPLGLFRE